MIKTRQPGTMVWVLFLTILIAHGVAPPASICGEKPGTETVDVTAVEIAPFLGKWSGTFEWQPRDRATSTSFESLPVQLVVAMASGGKPLALLTIGPRAGKYARGHASGGSGQYPVTFSRKGGVVYMEFRPGKGNSIQFHMEGNELHGASTSPTGQTRCDLKKTGQ